MAPLHERVARALDEAGDLVGPDLVQHVRAAHAHDPELVSEVARLLGHAGPGPLDRDLGSMARAAAEYALRTTPSPSPPSSIGSYRVVREIGRGGMGVVYEAEQPEPRRRVAIKVIGALTTDGASRLRREASTMARVKHPGIAQIHEAGVDPTLGPYIVMEYIDGPHILDYARVRQLPVRRRLELLALVCDAVHAAHQRGVIHRDLKPSNVLVETLPDGTAAPKVVDFGVALPTHLESDRTVTASVDPARIVGTIGYMSPESIEPPPGGVDTRADVYALGVMLYELVSGRMPIDVQGAGLTEAARRVLTSAPTSLERLEPSARGDLSLIAGTAVAKERDRRYSSAAALGADIRHFLADEPIAARPPTLSYQLRKLARRHRAASIAAVTALSAVIGGAVLATAFGISESHARARMAEALAQAERRVYAASVSSAARAAAQADAPAAAAALAQAPEHLRGWEWEFLSRRADGAISRAPPIEGHAFPIAATPDGLLVVAYNERLVLLAPNDWSEHATAAIAPGPRQWAASSDGSLVAHCSADGRLRVFRTSDLTELWSTDGVRGVDRFPFSSQNEIVLRTNEGARTTILDARTGAPKASFDSISPQTRGAFFSADPNVWFEPGFGQTLIARARDTGDRLWESDQRGAWRFAPGIGTPVMLRNNVAVFIDPRTGNPLHTLNNFPAAVSSISCALGSDAVAITNELGSITLWSASTARPFHTLLGHTRSSETVTLPDGRLASGTAVGDLRLWDPDALPVRTIVAPPERLTAAKLAQGHDRLIALGWGSMLAWETTHGSPIYAPYLGRTRGNSLIALAPDASKALVSGFRAGPILIRIADGAILKKYPELARPWTLAAWTPEGVLLIEQDGKGVLLNPGTSETTALSLPPCSTVLAAPDTGALLGTSAGELLRWIPGASPNPCGPPHTGPMTAIARGADGSLVTTDASGSIMFRRADGSPIRTAHVPARPSALALSTDGRRAAVCTPGAVHLIDTEDADLVLSMEGPAIAFDVSFSADGSELLVAGLTPLTVYSTRREAGSRQWRQVQDGALIATSLFTSAPRILGTDVEPLIRAHPRLAEHVRDFALRAAAVWGDRVPMLNSECWAVAIASSPPSEDAARAVRVMSKICATYPDGNLLNTLAYCQYRAGMYEEALATFTASERFNSEAGDPNSADPIGLAMSNARLGRLGEARRWLEIARTRLKEDADERMLLREASDLMAQH